MLGWLNGKKLFPCWVRPRKALCGVERGTFENLPTKQWKWSPKLISSQRSIKDMILCLIFILAELTNRWSLFFLKAIKGNTHTHTHTYIYIQGTHMMYIITVHRVPKCMSCHKAIVVITERAHCFHYCIYR